MDTGNPKDIEEQNLATRLFWGAFHRGDRKGAGRPLTGAIEEEELTTHGSKSLPWVEGTEHRALGMTDMNWKFRSARSPILKKLGPQNEVHMSPRSGKTQFPSLSATRRTAASSSKASRSSRVPLSPHQRDCRPIEDTEEKLSVFGPSDGSMRIVWHGGLSTARDPQGKHMERVPSASHSASLPDLHSMSAQRAAAAHALLFRPSGSSRPTSQHQRRPGSQSRRSRPGSRAGKSVSALPPIRKAVLEKYRPLGARRPEAQELALFAKKYIHACDAEQIVPQPTLLFTGSSRKLDTTGKTLSDSDLLAMCAAGTLRGVKEVDLSRCTMLSDQGLATFLENALGDDAARGALQRLNLSDCIQAGQATQQSLLNLCSPAKAASLQSLNLNGVTLSVRLLQPLCEALGQNPSLKTLNLAGTGLGSALNAMPCISHIFESKSIKTLDLSWNSFNAEDLAQLGVRVVEKQVVKSLCLSNCAAASHKNNSISPCVFFIEKLIKDQGSLTSLDLSMNRIDFRGALVIEDALENSRSLHTLDVSSNPLGVTGLRCLLRLLCRTSAGLLSMNIENSFNEDSLTKVQKIQTFTYANPGGFYTLDMHRPYHRSLLRTLYKMSEMFGVPPDVCFTIVSYQLGQYQHPAQKDQYGVWPVVTEGQLQFSFSIDHALELKLKNVQDDDHAEVLSRFSDMMRITPDFRKLIPLLAQWRSLHGCSKEQATMLAALSRDFRFTAIQLRQFAAADVAMSGLTLANLLPTLIGDAFDRWLVIQSVAKINELIKTMSRCKELLLFNPDSPTGKYILDLSTSSGAYVAQALAILDRWEFGVTKRKGLQDTSEKGDWSNVRNAKYMSQPLEVFASSFDSWIIPETDWLELDYVSSLRLRSDSTVLDENTFTEMLKVLEEAKCGGFRQIQVTRLLAHSINLNSFQMRRLLGVYKTSEMRTEALVCLFFRVVDIHHEKIFRARFEDQSELQALRKRLGSCNFCPYIQPEQATLEFDLSVPDQRIAANNFLTLATSERRENLKNPRYTFPDGTIDEFAMGLPRSWDTLATMPTSGICIG
eukprot:TRINITY_DN9351_c0_g1_i2.p1 TRINITY_DN9351_c0_g1~~TRINITY_DN9351_c0_g1_i2.p1  ORF type:complete len:1123 (+),score=171.64 TRINITY_DN9351_c0_g1_i2:216-3371(+)